MHANFGILANQFFSTEIDPAGSLTLLGAFCFSIQIYADFSGYSDIAIGLDRLLGYDLMKNFQTPYFSTSFTEFWHRCHISLSTWFRDYVYIPLGGNRRTALRVAINIGITFLLSGLWHGANWTFLLWGALHGLLLIVERWRPWPFRRPFFSTGWVFCWTVLLWLPFRAQGLEHLSQLFGTIVDFSTYAWAPLTPLIEMLPPLKWLALLLVLTFFALTEYRMQFRDFSEWIQQQRKVVRWSGYYVLLLLILLLGNFDVKPYFIYFQF